MSKCLVAYFSRSGEQYKVGQITEGNTKKVAKIIAEEVGADLYEIKVVEDNYPLEYKTLLQYSKIERNLNLRPELSGEVENFDQYETIFLGYPNWWGDMPMPVYTFLEKYDFTNKYIAPFCTHEGSGFGGIRGLQGRGAKVIKEFDLLGHIAQENPEQARENIKKWLSKLEY